MPYNKHIDSLRASADIIDEVDGLTSYFGFCSPGTIGTDEAKFSIMKITQSAAAYPILTTFTWANGSSAYNLVWDNWATYSFQFKTF